jgi:hypothetical protein
VQTTDIKTQVRNFLVSELTVHPKFSVRAMVEGHHVHVDFLKECLQALQLCIQEFQRERTQKVPVKLKRAPITSCIDSASFTDINPVKLEIMVQQGNDFAALVKHNDQQNAEGRRSNRLVLQTLARLMGVPFNPQVSKSVQCVFSVQCLLFR